MVNKEILSEKDLEKIEMKEVWGEQTFEETLKARGGRRDGVGWSEMEPDETRDYLVKMRN